MAAYKVTYNPVTKVANVIGTGDANPAGSTALDTIEFDPNAIRTEPDETSYVLYQLVQELLYKIGVQDMNSVSIVMGLTVDE